MIFTAACILVILTGLTYGSSHEKRLRVPGGDIVFSDWRYKMHGSADPERSTKEGNVRWYFVALRRSMDRDLHYFLEHHGVRYDETLKKYVVVDIRSDISKTDWSFYGLYFAVSNPGNFKKNTGYISNR